MSKILDKSTVVLVKKVLVGSLKARDDDRFINCTIWNKECDELGLDTRKEFLNAYYKGRLTNHDSITRCRRKLQEMYPELRGEKYEERQEILEPKVKEEIKNMKP